MKYFIDRSPFILSHSGSPGTKEESRPPAERSVDVNSKERLEVRGKKEVRYIVSRLLDPDNREGKRETLGWHPSLELAKSQADRTGPGTFVDAEGGTLYFGGPTGRQTRWDAEWTNPNLYEGRHKKVRLPEIAP
jgi:hypothetical protein